MARPTKNGVSDIMKFGSFFAPSCQFAAVTPKWSNIISERRNPGVTAIAVTFVLLNSRAIEKASRMTDVFTKS